MRTVAFALPYRMQPEYNREFYDWSTDNDIVAFPTRLSAETPDDEWHPTFVMWNVTGEEKDLVHLKLRWGDIMSGEWWLSDLEKSVAELLFYETKDRL